MLLKWNAVMQWCKERYLMSLPIHEMPKFTCIQQQHWLSSPLSVMGQSKDRAETKGLLKFK